ncbi:MAG: small multi-drug export protein [Patescibacteria group bacterium]
MFNIDYAALFNNFPPELATLLIAMIPIAELRVALPIALGSFHLPLWSAFLWSFIGNLLPILFILWWLEPVSNFLMRKSKFFNRFFTWLFSRTRKKFESSAKRYGLLIALAVFVGIPLPLTGAWTGAIAAFLFNIPFKKALPSIAAGVIMAGIIVSLIYYGVLGLF